MVQKGTKRKHSPKVNSRKSKHSRRVRNNKMIEIKRQRYNRNTKKNKNKTRYGKKNLKYTRKNGRRHYQTGGAAVQFRPTTTALILNDKFDYTNYIIPSGVFEKLDAPAAAEGAAAEGAFKMYLTKFSSKTDVEKAFLSIHSRNDPLLTENQCDIIDKNIDILKKWYKTDNPADNIGIEQVLNNIFKSYEIPETGIKTYSLNDKTKNFVILHDAILPANKVVGSTKVTLDQIPFINLYNIHQQIKGEGNIATGIVDNLVIKSRKVEDMLKKMLKKTYKNLPPLHTAFSYIREEKPRSNTQRLTRQSASANVFEYRFAHEDGGNEYIYINNECINRVKTITETNLSQYKEKLKNLKELFTITDPTDTVDGLPPRQNAVPTKENLDKHNKDLKNILLSEISDIISKISEELNNEQLKLTIVNNNRNLISTYIDFIDKYIEYYEKGVPKAATPAEATQSSNAFHEIIDEIVNKSNLNIINKIHNVQDDVNTITNIKDIIGKNNYGDFMIVPYSVMTEEKVINIDDTTIFTDTHDLLQKLLKFIVEINTKIKYNLDYIKKKK